MSAARRLLVLSAALLLFRLGSAAVVFQPGYTDAYYYGDIAKRLAAGQGLTADFLWNFLEAGPDGGLPVPSHRFWMPLSTVLQAGGIKALPFVEPFRAAQAMEILIAAFIPLVSYRAARSLGASANASLVAAAVAGLGGAFAPGWVSLDAFAPAAVLGSVFFLAYRRAATGEVGAALLAGLAVGGLFLARAEGALFGLALLALVPARATRGAGLAGSAAALAIGLAWLARDLALGVQPDLFARSALLVRYEDFFRAAPPTLEAFVAAGREVALAKAGALATNAVTFAFAFGLVLLPGMVVALRARRADVRAFAALAVVIYLAESLIWTLHSTRGSYFHSLAAFVPFGVALGIVGTGELLRAAGTRRVAALGGIAAALVVSAFALVQWDDAFNGPYRARLATLPRVPAGPFFAVDAAAWRWIADRPVLVTPPEGPSRLCAVAAAYGVRTVVLEGAHFSAYDGLAPDAGGYAIRALSDLGCAP